jgi:hypothetical protein
VASAEFWAAKFSAWWCKLNSNYIQAGAALCAVEREASTGKAVNRFGNRCKTFSTHERCAPKRRGVRQAVPLRLKLQISQRSGTILLS